MAQVVVLCGGQWKPWLGLERTLLSRLSPGSMGRKKLIVNCKWREAASNLAGVVLL